MERLCLSILCACALSVCAATENPPTAAEIMQRVAQNQDREQRARTQFVYEQTIHRTERSKAGKVLYEEFRTFAMTPGNKETTRKQISVRGRIWRKDHYDSFDNEPAPEPFLKVAWDDEDRKHTKDGVEPGLFLLTTEEQKKYSFELLSQKQVKGRPAYQIQFQPADPKEWGWSGEALIDAEEFQPVSVFTQLSRKLPFAVRTMLGTDVPGLGFSLSYTRVDKDLWFPATYGTEFGVRAIFFFNRTITESMENKNFKRATVESQIQYATP